MMNGCHTNGGAEATAGTALNNGENGKASKKQMPTVTAVKPVRPPIYISTLTRTQQPKRTNKHEHPTKQQTSK
jgi:hypothetical protein